MAAGLPFEDRRDFEGSARGLIAPLPNDGVITGEDGQPVWDLSRFAFLEEGAEAWRGISLRFALRSEMVKKARCRWWEGGG
jgi:alkyl sulfatase BDS1-like metallo-beta-lactamase superfamily hydrolase